MIDYYSNSYQFDLRSSNRSADYISGVVDLVLSKYGKDFISRSVESERQSLDEIKSMYSSEQNRIQDEWVKENEKLSNELLQMKEGYSTLVQEVTRLKDEHDMWVSKANLEKSTLIGKQEADFDSLQAIYREHMKLKKPAEYWNDMKRSYFKQGILWGIGAVLITIAFIWYLTVLLYEIPNWVGLIDKNKIIQAVKGTIILTLILSTAVYLLRLFVQLALSSFHLSRDAFERHQLTHVYLSMRDEGGMSENESGVVLQSLFSRADTGLHKGDSSPKMPDQSSIFGAFTRPNQ